jgi:hypothetical protein
MRQPIKVAGQVRRERLLAVGQGLVVQRLMRHGGPSFRVPSRKITGSGQAESRVAA